MAETHARRRHDARPDKADHQHREMDPPPAPGIMASPGLVNGHHMVPLRRSGNHPVVDSDRSDGDHVNDQTLAALRRHRHHSPVPPRAGQGQIRRHFTVSGKKYSGKKKTALPSARVELVKKKPLYTDVEKLARKWQADSVDRQYDDADEFYQALVDVVSPGLQIRPAGGQPGEQEPAPGSKKAWPTLRWACRKEGKVTPVNWIWFEEPEAEDLLAELLQAPIQKSSEGRTTACHANKHDRLPYHPQLPDGIKTLDQLPQHEQPDRTPYIEFLIADRKKEYDIERGIIDRRDGKLYLTAHYDEGSFVQLRNAPQALIDDWRKKAEKYCADLKGEEPPKDANEQQAPADAPQAQQIGQQHGRANNGAQARAGGNRHNRQGGGGNKRKPGGRNKR